MKEFTVIYQPSEMVVPGLYRALGERKVLGTVMAKKMEEAYEVAQKLFADKVDNKWFIGVTYPNRAEL